MCTAQKSEIFWDKVERFVKAFGYVLKLIGDRLLQRPALYENAFITADSAFPGCFGFIDCTKIRI